MNDYIEQYESFWKSLVENEDGTLNKDAVMRELSDYYVVMQHCGTIYCHFSGGMVSKPMTLPSIVIELANEREAERYADVLAFLEDVADTNPRAAELLDNFYDD